jgi:hypothetical protein
MPHPDQRGNTMQTLTSSVAAVQLADRQAVAAASCFAHQAAPVVSAAAAPAGRLVLRRAAGQDSAAITRLAQLDAAPRPSGPMLVAELDEEIVAAVPVDGGRAIADPFRPTAELVELLRLHATPTPAPASRLRPHMRLRIAA